MIKDDSKFSPKLVNDTVKYLVRSLYTDGLISNKDITNKESLKKAVQQLLAKFKIGFIIDYSDDLLSHAEYYFTNSEYNYSRIFYAIFFEHSINQIIEIHCRKNKISDNTRIEVIRNVNIQGKLTWLLELMNLPVFNKKYVKTIKDLADERNAFIHYKWNLESDEDNDSTLTEKHNIELEFKEIKKAVKYIKTYNSKLQFKGEKTRIDGLIKDSKVTRK